MSYKKCHRWLDEEVIQFLKLYRNMECLWNTGLREHRDKNKREKAYETIRDQMGLSDLTVLDVKNKIKGIRTTYSDELCKMAASIKEAKSVKDDVYKPKVFWFNLADSFLREVSRHGSMAMKKEDSLFNTDETGHHNDTEDDQEYIDNSHLMELPLLYPEGPSPGKDTLNSSLAKEDEYDLFGRSMAMQLRKLPELTSLELMQKMQLMVINAKKQLNKEKAKTKQRAKSANTPSTSRRMATPSPELSSGGSSPSHCYKLEVMSPGEADPTSSVCEGSNNFSYVTSVHAGNYPVTGQHSGDYVTLKTQREMKRKLASSDPLEVPPNKPSHSRFKNE